jgi:hypothetical protein
MLRRVVCVANAILAELLLDFLGDIEDRGFNFLALAAAEVIVSLGSRLVIFRCGSLVGESTFLAVVVAFVNKTRFGVPLFDDTFRVGVAEIVALDRVVRVRRGEGVDLDAEVSASFLARVLGVPFPLISPGKLLILFWKTMSEI